MAEIGAWIDYSELGEFKEWLKSNSWTIEPKSQNGNYQILRARLGKRVLILYESNKSNYPTVCKPDLDVVREFRQYKDGKDRYKKKQTREVVEEVLDLREDSKKDQTKYPTVSEVRAIKHGYSERELPF